MAALLNDSGRFKESEAVLNNSLRILEGIGVSPEAATYLLARSRLTDALVGQSRWKDALANHQASLDALSGDPGLAAVPDEQRFGHHGPAAHRTVR